MYANSNLIRVLCNYVYALIIYILFSQKLCNKSLKIFCCYVFVCASARVLKARDSAETLVV
jgi:prolipoprotein diacylglyceryltransferase